MKCKHCGKKIIKFQLWEGQEDGLKLNESPRIIWKNWFKMDWYSVMWLITIFLVVWGYKVDTEKCDAAVERPCEFCETTGCCAIDYTVANQKEMIKPIILPEFNITE